MPSIRSISWRLDEDGGGTAYVTINHGAHADEAKYVFDSLEELPAQIAQAIKDDGRTEGELPRAPA